MQSTIAFPKIVTANPVTGFVLQGQKYVQAFRNISISVPESFIEHDDDFKSVPLIDLKSLVKSETGLNYKVYINCLKVGLSTLSPTQFDAMAASSN